MGQPSMGWRECVKSSLKDGTALASSTTPTSILHATQKPQFDPNFLQEGMDFTLEVLGRMSNMNPTPGNLTLEGKLGSIVVMTTGAIPLNTAAAKANLSWKLKWDFGVRAIGNGTTANVFHIPEFECETVNGSLAGMAGTFMPATPGVGAGFASDIALILDLFATFSVNNAANSIQVHAMKLYRNNSF